MKKAVGLNLNAINKLDSIRADDSILGALEKQASAGPFASGEPIRKKVSPTLLVPNEKNKFSMRRDEEYLSLMDDITQRGITNDILVMEIPNSNSYKILSGHRRHAIALELNLEKVPVKVYPPLPNFDELVFVIRENAGTRQKYPMDMARSIKLLEASVPSDLEGRKRDNISKMLGISSRSVHNYAALNNLPESAQNWLESEYITLAQAQDILKSTDTSYIAALDESVKEIEDPQEISAAIAAGIKEATKKAAYKTITAAKTPSAIKCLKKTLGILVPLTDGFLPIPKKAQKEACLKDIATAIQILEAVQTALTSDQDA